MPIRLRMHFSEAFTNEYGTYFRFKVLLFNTQYSSGVLPPVSLDGILEDITRELADVSVYNSLPATIQAGKVFTNERNNFMPWTVPTDLYLMGASSPGGLFGNDRLWALAWVDAVYTSDAPLDGYWLLNKLSKPLPAEYFAVPSQYSGFSIYYPRHSAGIRTIDVLRRYYAADAEECYLLTSWIGAYVGCEFDLREESERVAGDRDYANINMLYPAVFETFSWVHSSGEFGFMGPLFRRRILYPRDYLIEPYFAGPGYIDLPDGFRIEHRTNETVSCFDLEIFNGSPCLWPTMGGFSTPGSSGRGGKHFVIGELIKRMIQPPEMTGGVLSGPTGDLSAGTGYATDGSFRPVVDENGEMVGL